MTESSDTTDWLYRTVLVFFSLSYSFHWGWLWNFYSVTCIHPLQYTLTHPFILCLCIIPSDGFTYCTGLPSSRRAARAKSSYCGVLSSNNIEGKVYLWGPRKHNRQPFCVQRGDFIVAIACVPCGPRRSLIYACAWGFWVCWKLSAAEQIKPDCCHTPAVVSILLTPLPGSLSFYHHRSITYI